MSSYEEREFGNVMASYDRKAHAAYFTIFDSGEVCKTIPWVEDVVNIDVDHYGNVVGIEVLL